MSEREDRPVQAPLTLLVAALAVTAPLTTLATGIGTPDLEDTGVAGDVGGLAAGIRGRINRIVAPTSGAPAFALAGDDVRIELADDRGVDLVRLRPSFGGGAEVGLPFARLPAQGSEVWQGPYARDVVPLVATVPEATLPGLYDVVILGGGAERADARSRLGEAASLAVGEDDVQRRSLRVYTDWPETIRMVLVADTQTGDPRALHDGFEDSTGIGLGGVEPHVPDPEPFNHALDQTFGIDVLHVDVNPADRWAAYREAIHQINALEPDLVLFAGDLNFGQLVPTSYHVEYEEAWALINGGAGVDGTLFEGFHAPTLLSPGNHDGYVASGEDGFAFWMATFGPPAFRARFDDVTFMSINTYDWSELDRMGAGLTVSAWGGQVRRAQSGWVRGELCIANGGEPVADAGAIAGVGCIGAGDERVVTFAHHSPSWVQDAFEEEYGGFYKQCPCEGTPGLEQAARGAITFTTTDQGWSGEGRLELRDTLREFHVDLHAAGHTHRDRVSRDLGDGTIVETAQLAREGLDITELQIVSRDGHAVEVEHAQGVALLRNAAGPLYVETTTAASDTVQYFGYKPVTWHPSSAAFPAGALGIAPFEMGYPMTRALLDGIARVPERWNEAHAEFGLYSTPTFPAG